MVEEPQQPIIPNETEDLYGQNLELSNMVESYRFFSNQVGVNQTIFQGIDIILKKLTKIESDILKLTISQDGNKN